MALKTFKKYSEEDLKFARRAGLKAKKPSWSKTRADGSVYQPKKTERNYNNFVDRYNKWVDKVKEYAKKYREKTKKVGGKTEAERVADALKKR